MSPGLVQTFRAFAYNNAWANHRLLGACAHLTQQEFEADRTSFFPSLQATLNHIYVIDLFYIDALEGGWLGPKAWENEVPYPSLAELRTAHALEAGWVQVNQGGGQALGQSYGGVKESGIGREMSLEGMLDSFTETKSVNVNLTLPPPQGQH